MHTVVLTELGIAVYQDDAKLYSIPFENPAEEYVAIKQQKSIPADLATRLIKEQSGVLVTDESLMSMLKNESIDAQMAGEEYLKKIQMEKPKILVESGFASDENDALEKLRDFAMSLSSSDFKIFIRYFSSTTFLLHYVEHVYFGFWESSIGKRIFV